MRNPDQSRQGRSALQQGLHDLSFRCLSLWEMDQRLKRARYPREDREQAILKLREWAYLDDEKFAQTYCRTKKERFSRKKIVYELRGKGVSCDDIARALDQEYSEEEELEYCRRHMLRAWDKTLKTVTRPARNRLPGQDHQMGDSLTTDHLPIEHIDYYSTQNWNSLVEAFKARFARKGYPCAGIQKIVDEERASFFPDTAKET